MSWAARRRFIIIVLLVTVGVAFAALISITVFYKTPSCTDGIQNGAETGVDCGGTCPYLCAAAEIAPTVLFTEALPNGAGRTDVIAAVENKNADAAAKNVPYTITLYGAGQTFVQKVSGVLDLPPHATVPVFYPGVASGQQAVTSAFLAIDPSAVAWTRMPQDPRIVPVVSNTSLGGTTAAPRITAVLSNATTAPLPDVKVIVTVRDAAGNAIAASQTIVPSVPAQGQATATFTWNAPFPGMPVSIEVVPLVPLP